MAPTTHGVPRLPTRLVRRSRLFDLLDAGVQGPVTLVAGQAGVGKTVLLASWVAAGRPPGPVAWLALDRADGDPARFWAHMLAAVRQTGAVPRSVLKALPPQLPGTDGALGHQLVAALGRLREPIVLVLDDFQAVSTPEILDGIQSLLRQAPPQLRLIIATRADPTLPQLPRLRLSGELVELRADDLAFTADEAAELLDGHRVRLSEADLAALCSRTQGWAAGLRLAALWLQDRPDLTRAVAAFAGTDRTVADYLVAEVLDIQPSELRDFLLSTCVVDQLSGALANELTGRQDGEQTLASLERANAFLVPVHPDRLWYRYHPLFAELLRFELRRRAPEELVRLQQRAARWHGDHGMPADAVRYALDAGDWAYGVDLLLRFGLGWALQGETMAIRQLADRLPVEVVRDTPELDVLLTFDRFERFDHEAARQHLGQARRRQPLLPEHRRDRFALLVALLELTAARRSGQLEAMLATAGEILTLQRTTDALGADAGQDEAVRSVALVNLGAAEHWMGSLNAAEDHLREGASAAARGGLGLVQLDGLSHLALLHITRGRLRAAYRTGRAAADLAESHGWSELQQAGGAYLALASASLEQNRLDDTARQLERALVACAAAPWRPVRLGAAIVQAWLRQAQGDTAGGSAALDTVRQDLADSDPPAPTWLRDWVILTDAELRTVAGDTGAARGLLERLEEDSLQGGAAPGPKVVAAARLELASGDATGAVQTLAPYLDGSPTPSSPRPLIAAWMLHAVATRQLGDPEQSSRSLEHALALAAPERFRQVFVDGGAPVRALLGAQLGTATSYRSFLGELLGHTAPPTVAASWVGLVEPLSDRERVVLRYLPSRLSAAEMGAELHLSVHTVKSHLRHLYRKLEVTSRREAVDRARELNLL